MPIFMGAHPALQTIDLGPGSYFNAFLCSIFRSIQQIHLQRVLKVGLVSIHQGLRGLDSSCGTHTHMHKCPLAENCWYTHVVCKWKAHVRPPVIPSPSNTHCLTPPPCGVCSPLSHCVWNGHLIDNSTGTDGKVCGPRISDHCPRVLGVWECSCMDKKYHKNQPNWSPHSVDYLKKGGLNQI